MDAVYCLHQLAAFIQSPSNKYSKEGRNLLQEFKNELRPALPEDLQYTCTEAPWHFGEGDRARATSQFLPLTAEDLRDKNLWRWRLISGEHLSQNQVITWSPELICEFGNRLWFPLLRENPAAAPHTPPAPSGWPDNVRGTDCTTPPWPKPPAVKTRIGYQRWLRDGISHGRDYYVNPDGSATIECLEEGVVTEATTLLIGDWEIERPNSSAGSWGGYWIRTLSTVK